MVDPRAELDEAKLRRYPWIAGEPVTLKNGQEWLVPSLPLEFRWPRRRFLRRRPTTEVEVGIFSADAKVCERILDLALKAEDEMVGPHDQFRLCFHALRINYQIEPEQATGLFAPKDCFWPVVQALLGTTGWQEKEKPEGSGPTDDGSEPVAGTSASSPEA